MDVVLALVAALLFALGTVLQQRAGLDAPAEGSNSACSCGWRGGRSGWPGSRSDALGFVPRRSRSASGGWRSCSRCWSPASSSRSRSAPGSRASACDGRRRRRVLVTGADRLPDHRQPVRRPRRRAGPRLADRRRRSAPRSARRWSCSAMRIAGRGGAAGTATGILFGLSAALTKAVVDEFGDELFDILGHGTLRADRRRLCLDDAQPAGAVDRGAGAGGRDQHGLRSDRERRPRRHPARRDDRRDAARAIATMASRSPPRSSGSRSWRDRRAPARTKPLSGTATAAGRDGDAALAAAPS